MIMMIRESFPRCFAAVLFMAVFPGLADNASAVALKGSLTTYFLEHEGLGDSILLDLGDGPIETGPISFALDTSERLGSFEIFNFDTMTAVEESDVLVSADILESLGMDMLPVHISEVGVISEIAPATFIPDMPTEFEMAIELTGTITIPDGTLFGGFTWTNDKKQEVGGYIEVDENGKVKGVVAWRKTFSADGTLTQPGQAGLPLEMMGTGVLVPEPATVALLGLGSLPLLRRRRR
jgi:hypothetical protein